MTTPRPTTSVVRPPRGQESSAAAHRFLERPTRPVTVAILIAAVTLLAACGEKAQTAGASKVDGKAWESAGTPYTAAGWKAGDQASWESQLRQRAQSQNEYLRAPAKAP